MIDIHRKINGVEDETMLAGHLQNTLCLISRWINVQFDSKESYRNTRQNLFTAFSFNGIGVTAATTGLVHPVFAMIAMVLSVSAVLVNSFVGQSLSGEDVNTGLTVEKVMRTESVENQ